MKVEHLDKALKFDDGNENVFIRDENTAFFENFWVSFSLEVDRKIQKDDGDYWTPPTCDVEDEVRVTLLEKYHNEDGFMKMNEDENDSLKELVTDYVYELLEDI